MPFFNKVNTYHRSGKINRNHTNLSFGIDDFTALPDQLRATLTIPVIDVSMTLKSIINLAQNLIETLINFTTLSPLMAIDSFKKSLSDLSDVAVFSISAVTDTTAALLTLGTKTVGAAINVGLYAGLIAVSIIVLPLYFGSMMLMGIVNSQTSHEETITEGMTPN